MGHVELDTVEPGFLSTPGGLYEILNNAGDILRAHFNWSNIEGRFVYGRRCEWSAAAEFLLCLPACV